MSTIQVVGGLGSQMFAYALYLSLKSKGKNISCDFSWYNYNYQHNGAELNKLFGCIEERNVLYGILLNSNKIYVRILKKILKETKLIKYYENKTYNYDENILLNNQSYLYDNSCWSSYKYFNHIEKEIKKIYKFPEIKEEKNKKIENLIKNTNSVSIHIRRGDYLENDLLGNLAPISYYEKAINYIKQNVKNPKFFIFSNDINWCKENLDLKSAEYIDWNKGEKSYRDIQLMSFCKHNIIPNSSFSWWGAWLNDNRDKIVIAPERWVNKISDIELKDMNLEGWITLKNYEEKQS
ncbi:alpha-1,2-fucosyltransferase [Cetobacterium sp.]|uniref:alpha-1,2-fucosyltransferase n=1 Tax=Cetobacterium sp. TaxID=2071632 RepID=UPI003F3D8553